MTKPNEGRADLNRLPVQGGNTPYLQQQNFSLAALDRRDQEPAPEPGATAADNAAETDVEDVQAELDGLIRKELGLAA